jgi:membrane-bound ClpP family serine protease
MEPTVVVILLLAAGLVVLVAEIFIPSHGLLCLVGLALLGTAIYRAYSDLTETAGHLSVAATVVSLPTMAWIAVKTFHHTPWGKKIAPPNPIARAEEFAPQHESLKTHIGQTGKSITPLRPVGTCMINGERINCVAETGMIEDGIEIEAIGVRGRELEVRPLSESR